MVDFVPEPRERLEAPICKAIESRDFKQALKFVDKRLAKNSDPYLLALRCFILCNSHLVVERGRALGIIVDLSNSPEKRHSVAELDLYDEGLKVLFPERQDMEGRAICKMRADAVKATPKDENLALTCFRACLKRDSLEYAQQIANSLEKNFPSNRAYQFWSITMTALYAMSPDCPVQLAQVYSNLAYAKIKNLAASTLKIDQSTPTNRSLQTPQELLLFYRLLAAHGEDAEGLGIYKDKLLGPTSKIAKDEWIFRRKHLELMEMRNEWQALFDTTLELLSMSRANNKTGAIIDARGADWLVWKGFIRSVSELQRTKVAEIALEELEQHLDEGAGLDKPYLRNAHLAFLELRFSKAPVGPIPGPFRFVHGSPPVGELSGRAFAICRYLYKYGHSASSFDDVKIYVEKLSAQDQRSILKSHPHILKHLVGSVAYLGGEYLNDVGNIRDRHHGAQAINLGKPGPESSWHDITSGVTGSKLSYFIKSSLAERIRSLVLEPCSGQTLSCWWCQEKCGKFCNSCLQGLAMECLQSYSWTMDDDDGIGKSLKPTDKHPADEWAILAAMCLLKLAGCRPWITKESHDSFSKLDTHYLLRATLILEFAHTRSRANPQISLLLVRLYSQLGAGSLAMRAYNQLGLKQIQGDTLSYTLFDRISSLHPHTVDDSDFSAETLNPSKQLKRLQRLYRGFRNHIITNSWRSFENGSYDSIFQLMEVSTKLSRSMASAMSAIELRRIDRLTQTNAVLNTNSHGYDVLPPEPACKNYSDNSDYSSFPNYEHSKEYPFERYTRIAPGPSQIRIQAFLILEELWMVALSVSESKVKQTATHARFRRFDKVMLRVKEAVEQDPPGLGIFTIPERLLVQIGISLIRLLIFACDASTSHAESVPSVIADLCGQIRHIIAEFMGVLEVTVQEENPPDDWMPMFITTLHPLYTAHEAGTLALALADYFSKAAVWVNPEVKPSVALMNGAARKLRNLVSKKSMKVRSWMNGPRLDWVLEQIKFEKSSNELPTSRNVNDIDEEAFERINGYRRDLLPDAPESMGSLLTECVSPDFLESWAGELVESWRESVIGLACLRSDGLAHEVDSV